MKWTDIPTGQTNCAFQRFMGSFGDNADTVVSQLNSDDVYLNRVSVLCKNNGFEPSTNQTRAREIMGANVFGVEEAIKHYGISPSGRHLAYMAEVGYSEQTLIACKDTHILSAVFRFSGLEVREKVKSKKVFYKQNKQNWYDEQPFANDKGALEWHLVRKTHVKDSMSKTWSQQQDLLLPEEETPTFQVLAYTVIGHFLATDEKLFEDVYVRCSDLDSDGHHVCVRFLPDGFYIAYQYDDGRDDYVGVSFSRKQES